MELKCSSTESSKISLSSSNRTFMELKYGEEEKGAQRGKF